MTTRHSGWLTKLIRRVKPIFLVGFFGTVGGGIGYWLATEHINAAQILLVSLVLLVTALMLELAREIADTQDAIEDMSPCHLSWDEEDTLHTLKRLDGNARDNCHVRAVWGALSPSGPFQAFMVGQLKQVCAHRYTLERWIDTDCVNEAACLEHLQKAFDAMAGGRYSFHLVHGVPFGAMVVNGNIAAVNFVVHHNRRDVIGISSADERLAQRVDSLISELGVGVELSRGRHDQVSLSELETLVTNYYRSNGTP